MAQVASRSGLLALLAGAIVAGAAFVLLRPAAEEAPAMRGPAVVGGLAQQDGDSERVTLPELPPADAAPEPLEPMADSTQGPVPLSDAELAAVRFDDEIYGRVFIARLIDSHGRTPRDLQLTATVQVITRATDGQPQGAASPMQLPELGPEIGLHRASADEDGLWRWPIPDTLAHAELAVQFRSTEPRMGDLLFLTTGRADAVLDVLVPAPASLHGQFDAGPLFLPPKAKLSLDATWSWKDGHGGSWSGKASTPIDEDGYRFERSVLGELDLALDVAPGGLHQALGKAPHLLAPGWDGRWDIHCADLATLNVQVLDAETSAPVPDTRLSLADDREWLTDADGRACFLGLPPDSIGVIRAEHDDYIPAFLRPHGDRAARRAERPADEAPQPLLVVIRLDRGVTVAGRIVDEKGDGVASAQVMLTHESGMTPGNTFTDATGTFLLDRVSPGPRQLLTIFSPVLGSTSFLLDVTPGMRRQTWTLRPAPRLAVSVLRADGTPAAGSQISVLSLGPIHREPKRTAPEDGRVDFGMLGFTGDALVCAHGEHPADGLASQRLQLQPGETREVQLVLAPDPLQGNALPPRRLELHAFDPRTSESPPVRLRVKIFPAATSDLPRDTQIIRLGPTERTLLVPHGIIRLDIEDPSREYLLKTLALDTDALPDGSVIEVPLRAWR